MKQFRILIAVAATSTGMLLAAHDANAWVAAAGGYRGGAVAVGGYHGAYVGGYHAGGCYGCGAAAGAVAGMAVGAMAGAAYANAAYPTTVVVQQPAPVYVQQPVYAAQGNMPIGTQLAALPPGSTSMVVNSVNYYQNGPTWFKPYYGSSGVYYQVVPAP